LGQVEAPDEAAAIEKAAAEFRAASQKADRHAAAVMTRMRWRAICRTTAPLPWPAPAWLTPPAWADWRRIICLKRSANTTSTQWMPICGRRQTPRAWCISGISAKRSVGIWRSHNSARCFAQSTRRLGYGRAAPAATTDATEKASRPAPGAAVSFVMVGRRKRPGRRHRAHPP
jgi:hypothetical protein